MPRYHNHKQPRHGLSFWYGSCSSLYSHLRCQERRTSATSVRGCMCVRVQVRMSVYAYVRALGVPWFIEYHSCILHSSFCMHLLLTTTLVVCADCTSLCVCVLWQWLRISCQSGTRSRVAVGSDVMQTQPWLRYTRRGKCA